MDAIRTLAVGRKKKLETNSERIDLRAPEAWVQRLEDAAAKKGLNISSYIRMVCSERMDADGIEQAKPRPRKRD